MSIEIRREAIHRLAEMHGSHVITYVTSTRENLESPMSMDVIPIIYRHIQLIESKPEDTKIDLFVHSNGGDGVVPWRLVTLLRQYCSELTLLVPNRAYSAATLLALGADRVLMHPMGNLGPIDPTVTTPFNPPDPANPAARKLGVSVEDVAAYIALVKEDVGIHHEDELVQAFLALANKDVIHPLALGSVKRSTAQGRMLGEKLLKKHKNPMPDHEISEVVKTLTSELYYHGHPIDWNEARSELGLKFVDRASDDLCDLMWDLFSEYSQLFQLDSAFDTQVEAARSGNLPSTPPPPGLVVNGAQTTGQNVSEFRAGPFTTVAMESRRLSSHFEVTLDIIARRDWTGQLQALVAVADSGWHHDVPASGVQNPAPS
jgi:hypothetical protein